MKTSENKPIKSNANRCALMAYTSTKYYIYTAVFGLGRSKADRVYIENLIDSWKSYTN